MSDVAGTRLMLDLSGEHGTVPRAEVLAVLEAEGIRYTVDGSDDRVLLVTAHGESPKAVADRLAGRLSMCHSISIHLATAERTAEGIMAGAERAAAALPMFPGTASFRIRCVRMTGHGQGLDVPWLEKETAQFLWKGRRVDLKHPDKEYKILISSKVYIGETLAEPDRVALESKRAQFRPFFSPITLHPRQARTLVNLARFPAGGTFLDPFCGTGGILLEAGTMGLGAKLIGSDVDPKMVEGCMTNLEHYGVTGCTIIQSDIRNVSRILGDLKVDAIATDPPYGRSSNSFGDDTWDLYAALLESATQLLAPGRFIAVSLPCKELTGLPTRGLIPVEMHAAKVHRSLTRYFHILRNEG